MKLSFVHFYLFLWCLYWLQGVLYPSGGYISVIILFVLLAISLTYFVIANYRYKLPKVLKILSIIIFVFTIYGLVAIVSGRTFSIVEIGNYDISAVGYLKNIYISLLPVYTIYVFSKRTKLNESNIRIWAIIFLVIAIVGFYRYQYETLESMAARGITSEELTNNGAYGVLAIMCLIPFFYKNTVLQYSILVICLYYLLIGMKRGALVCGALSSIWYLYYSIKFERNWRRSLITFLFTLGIIFFVVNTINYMLDNSEYFRTRLENTLAGETSHRVEIQSVLWAHLFEESNPFLLLFGNGAYSTLDIGINFAHNDWLEIAINNGLFMIVLYLIYWFHLFKQIRLSKHNVMCYLVISIYFIIFFTKTFFSMSYADVPTCASLALGYALANYKTL